LHILKGQIVTKKLSDSLKRTFDTTGIVFDRAKFEATFQTAISGVMTDSKIPPIAKRKFLEDISTKANLLSNVTMSDIDNLKSQRNVSSLGIEAIELSSKTTQEIQTYYLNKILTETIVKYITPTAIGLREAFSADRAVI
jgi:hypothetical protein